MSYKKKEKTRLHLWEQQGHRCAVCTKPIDYYADRHSNEAVGLAKIDRDLPHSKENSVVVCIVCAAHYTRYPTLLDYYEALQAGIPKKVKPERVADLWIIEEINRRLVIECAKLGFPPVLLTEYSRFKYAPRSAIPEIVERSISIFKERYGRGELLIQRKTLRSATWHKRLFLGRQNNRCFYCNTVFSKTQGHPRYATWDHVIELRKGGPNCFENAVLACEVCNNMRDKLDMTSEEFYQWAIDNPDLIEARSQELLLRKPHLVIDKVDTTEK